MTDLPPPQAEPTIDAATVADLGRRIGGLEEGTATKQEIADLKTELEGMRNSIGNGITRAEYEGLKKELEDAKAEMAASNNKPAEIKPPAPPPEPKKDDLPPPPAKGGAAKFGIGLFRRRV